MGFPVGYTEVFLPKLFLHMLSLLGFIRTTILTLFRFFNLTDFLEPGDFFYHQGSPTRLPDHPAPPAVLIREFLPVVKFEDVAGSEDPPESCAVCLYEFEAGEEIRWLTNCKHIFHRCCVDRWMDYDQYTCPLCRTPFVPHLMLHEFNQRLCAVSGVCDFYSDYSSISGL